MAASAGLHAFPKVTRSYSYLIAPPAEKLTERSNMTSIPRIENSEFLESEDRFRTLFHLSPISVYSCDTAGVIQDFNDGAAALWGRSPERGDTDERFCGSFKLFLPDGTF